MMQLRDSVPVVQLPDGRWAIIDTGCRFAAVVAAGGDTRPVSIDGRSIHPVVAEIDLDGIASRIGTERLDMLIGAPVLSSGFTMDLENGEFAFHATEPRIDEAEVATLPCQHPGFAGLPSPVVELTIRGVTLQGVFDTGAAYSAWMTRAQEPARPITATRTDFHVGVDGQLLDFPVLMRTESVRFGNAVLDLDVAYLPETWPELYPDCLIGMDVPKELGARRFTLDPHRGALRFYRRA